MRIFADRPAEQPRSWPSALVLEPSQLSRALGLASNGVVFVSKHRWVLYANQDAIAMAQSTGSIRVDPGRECLASAPLDATVLDSLLATALRQPRGPGVSRAAIGTLSGSSPGGGIVAVACPYRIPIGEDVEDGVLLLIRIPGTLAEDMMHTASTMFAFTPAEARFAAELAMELDPDPRWRRRAGGDIRPSHGYLATPSRWGAMSWLCLH